MKNQPWLKKLRKDSFSTGGVASICNDVTA